MTKNEKLRRVVFWKFWMYTHVCVFCFRVFPYAMLEAKQLNEYVNLFVRRNKGRVEILSYLQAMSVNTPWREKWILHSGTKSTEIPGLQVEYLEFGLWRTLWQEDYWLQPTPHYEHSLRGGCKVLQSSVDYMMDPAKLGTPNDVYRGYIQVITLLSQFKILINSELN